MDPERITRGVISLTTGDSRRGSLGFIFRFLGLCVCLGVQRGLSRVLIKYSGNVRLQTESYYTGAKRVSWLHNLLIHHHRPNGKCIQVPVGDISQVEGGEGRLG